MAAAAAGLDHLNRQRVEGESGITPLEKKITIVALAALVAGIVLMALFPPLSTLFCVGIALGALSTTFLGTVAYHVLHKNPTKEEAAEELATLINNTCTLIKTVCKASVSQEAKAFMHQIIVQLLLAVGRLQMIATLAQGEKSAKCLRQKVGEATTAVREASWIIERATPGPTTSPLLIAALEAGLAACKSAVESFQEGMRE